LALISIQGVKSAQEVLFYCASVLRAFIPGQDYEYLPETSEASIRMVMIRVMLALLTDAAFKTRALRQPLAMSFPLRSQCQPAVVSFTQPPTESNKE
jgi:hypothetical protein